MALMDLFKVAKNFNRGAEVPENTKFCPHCGNKL